MYLLYLVETQYLQSNYKYTIDVKLTFNTDHNIC